MNKKKRIILIVIIVLIIISLGLWISWIIPEQIAKNSAEKYLKENFPEKQFEYENIEWVSSFGGFDIKFKDENGKTVSLIMGGRFFPDTPTEGTNDLEEGYKIEYKGISDINDFYNHSITENYTDIRTLPQNYSIEQAQKDNCFVIGAMVHNDNLYNDFMNKYNQKENAFIRVVQSTAEGDIYIIDVLYEARNNKIHLVKDDTRDRLSAQEDRTIKYKTYEKTGVWNYQNSQYWVAYNGELPDENTAENLINSGDLFIIATVN